MIIIYLFIYILKGSVVDSKQVHAHHHLGRLIVVKVESQRSNIESFFGGARETQLFLDFILWDGDLVECIICK